MPTHAAWPHPPYSEPSSLDSGAFSRVLGENQLTTLPAGLFDELEALQDL